MIMVKNHTLMKAVTGEYCSNREGLQNLKVHCLRSFCKLHMH